MWCMHRSAELPLGFTAPLAWRSLICPLRSAGGQAWSPALQCLAPLACSALRSNCLQDRLAWASTSTPFGRSVSAPCAAYPFGSSALRAEASSSCMLSVAGCGNTSFPSFSRSVSTDYRPAFAGFVLSDIPLRGKTEIFFLLLSAPATLKEIRNVALSQG